MAEAIISELEVIVGPENISTKKYDCMIHGVDRGALLTLARVDDYKLPIAVVRPINAVEVSAILRLANKKSFPVGVRGAGTVPLSTHNLKRPGGIILDLNRMNWIKMHEEDCYVEVGPTVTTLQLNTFLDPYGYYFPLYPGSWRIASLGGIISSNTSGHIVDSYHGKPGSHVLGLEVVLPTGEIIETGTKVLRPPAGCDLTRLFIGSEGLFGVITNIYLRLLRKPLEERYGVVVFEDAYDAAKAVMRIFCEKVPYPKILECMDEKIAPIAFKKIGVKIQEGSVLIIATDGEAPGEAQWKLDRIIETCKKERVKEVLRPKDYEEWEPIWTVRERVAWISRRPIAGGCIDPPMSKLVDATRQTRAIIDKFCSLYGMDGFLYGHYGGPTLHPMMLFPPDVDFETRVKITKELKADFVNCKLNLGASRGEQGIFPNFKDWFVAQFGEAYYDALKRIKRALDPNDILNPGNLEGIVR